MVFSSKPFKVRPIYKILYQSCIDVVSKKKSPLTKALLEKEIGIEKSNELLQFKNNELITHMIYSFKNQINMTSYESYSIFLKLHKRHESLKKLAREKEIPTNLEVISFRIPQDVTEEIYLMKTTTVSEIIELSILNYLITCDEDTYRLIMLSFQYY